MRQWIWSALVQMMACRLFGAKPLSKPMLGYHQLDKLQRNFDQNSNFLIHENAFENVVCEMTANLSRGRWINSNVHTLSCWISYVYVYVYLPMLRLHAGESLRFLASDWMRNGSWARGSVPGGSATVSLPLTIYFFSQKHGKYAIVQCNLRHNAYRYQ